MNTQDSQNEKPNHNNHEPIFGKQHLNTKRNPTGSLKGRIIIKKKQVQATTYHDIDIYEANSPKP